MKRFLLFALVLCAFALPAFAQDPQPATRNQERVAQRCLPPRCATLKQMDANQDGALSRDEWQGKPKRFGKLDADHDGRVTTDEMKSARRNGGKRALQQMDANSDGQISRTEWAGKPKAFGRLDANNDGVITTDELKARRGKQ